MCSRWSVDSTLEKRGQLGDNTTARSSWAAFW
jgi:hypothetical protein